MCIASISPFSLGFCETLRVVFHEYGLNDSVQGSCFTSLKLQIQEAVGGRENSHRRTGWPSYTDAVNVNIEDHPNRVL